MSNTAAAYSQEYEQILKKRILPIMPPEGVPIGFEKASVGARFGAQFLDLLFTYGVLIGLLIVVALNFGPAFESLVAVFALLSFLIRIPYYILTELVWNGRTIGKLLVKIRVISANGRRLEPHQVVVRNLMKEAEVFMPISLVFGVLTANGYTRWLMALWLVTVILVPIINKRNQRLGDMIAGTFVVVQPKIKKVAEVTESAKAYAETYQFSHDQLEKYGRFELQSLEKILRDKGNARIDYERDRDVARAIRAKIGYIETVPDTQARPFLLAFYNAQRAHLEQRQIFGDRREDKFHDKRKPK